MFLFKENVRSSEQAVLEHQLYQEVYTEARDWLNSLTDMMTTLSDLRGDKQTVEEKLHKIKVKSLINRDLLYNCLSHNLTDNILSVLCSCSHDFLDFRIYSRISLKVTTKWS